LTFTPNRPGGHGKQADDPVTLFEVPTAQGVQAWALDTALKDPMGQSTQPLGDTDTNLPAGQVDPVVEVHAVAAEEPTGEVVPEGHGVHDAATGNALYVLAGHRAHTVEPTTSLYRPTPHGVHSDVPSAEVTPYRPAGHARHDVDPAAVFEVPRAHGVHTVAAALAP